MTNANPQKAVQGPSPALGLGVLGLIAFVAGCSVVARALEAEPDVAMTAGLVLVALGLYGLVVGAVAVGVRLANPSR